MMISLLKNDLKQLKNTVVIFSGNQSDFFSL